MHAINIKLEQQKLVNYFKKEEQTEAEKQYTQYLDKGDPRQRGWEKLSNVRTLIPAICISHWGLRKIFPNSKKTYWALTLLITSILFKLTQEAGNTIDEDFENVQNPKKLRNICRAIDLTRGDNQVLAEQINDLWKEWHRNLTTLIDRDNIEIPIDFFKSAIKRITKKMSPQKKEHVIQRAAMTYLGIEPARIDANDNLWPIFKFEIKNLAKIIQNEPELMKLTEQSIKKIIKQKPIIEIKNQQSIAQKPIRDSETLENILQLQWQTKDFLQTLVKCAHQNNMTQSDFEKFLEKNLEALLITSSLDFSMIDRQKLQDAILVQNSTCKFLKDWFHYAMGVAIEKTNCNSLTMIIAENNCLDGVFYTAETFRAPAEDKNLMNLTKNILGISEDFESKKYTPEQKQEVKIAIENLEQYLNHWVELTVNIAIQKNLSPQEFKEYVRHTITDLLGSQALKQDISHIEKMMYENFRAQAPQAHVIDQATQQNPVTLKMIGPIKTQAQKKFTRLMMAQ